MARADLAPLHRPRDAPAAAPRLPLPRLAAQRPRRLPARHRSALVHGGADHRRHARRADDLAGGGGAGARGVRRADGRGNRRLEVGASAPAQGLPGARPLPLARVRDHRCAARSGGSRTSRRPRATRDEPRAAVASRPRPRRAVRREEPLPVSRPDGLARRQRDAHQRDDRQRGIPTRRGHALPRHRGDRARRGAPRGGGGGDRADGGDGEGVGVGLGGRRHQDEDRRPPLLRLRARGPRRGRPGATRAPRGSLTPGSARGGSTARARSTSCPSSPRATRRTTWRASAATERAAG